MSIKNNNEKDNVEDKMFKNKIKKSISLTKFINNHKTKHGEQFTHTWFDNNNNFTFNIDDDEYHKFIELYKNECIKEYGKLHILEKPKDIGPLLFDFDFKQKVSKRILNKNQMIKIIEIINSVIKKYFKIKQNKKYLYDAYILLKKEPFYNENKKCYVDGFHIHYPDLILNVVDRFLIFDESKKEIINSDVFENIYDNLVESNKEVANDLIFDSTIIKRNSWFMYGSGKKIDNHVNLYELHYKVDFDINELTIDYFDNIEKIIDLLSIRFNKEKEIKYKNDISDKLEEISHKYIKKISNKFDVKKLFIKKNNDENEYNDEELEHNTNNKIQKLITKDNNKQSDDVEISKKLIKLLSKKRAGPWNDWIIVGWALFNISPTLLPEFIEFSKLDENKYKDGCCEKVWEDCSRYAINNTNTNGYTIASLYRWAKEDNPKGLNLIIREKINSLLEEGDIKTDFDVACIMKEIYKYDYVCTSITKNIWWQFNNHRWNCIEQAHTLSYKMSTEVSNEFKIIAIAYASQSLNETGQKQDLLVRKSSDIMKLSQDVKKKAVKDKILSQCCLLFYDDKFTEKLDQNNYLIGFNNGIYDLSNNIFRKGYPDDYVSKTVDYNYNNKLTFNDPMIKDIEKFFKSIHPEEDMKLYILCYCASLLEGGNKDQKFMIWTGSGSNSKGTLIELLDHTLGNYFGTLPPTLLTQKRKGSSNASPELADKFGTRVLTLQEPEEDDKINVGFMKELTGQDKIMARPLYANPFYYVPQFKILLACNKLPSVPSDDGGTWRRIRVIDFSQTFVDNPTLPNQQKKDPELREKLKTWNVGLIWLLINKYYPIYKEKKLDTIEPLRVKLSTDKYKKDSNIYIEFFNDHLENDKSKESLPKDLVWGLFKEWHSNAYNGSKAPPQKKLIEFFESNNYKIKGNVVYGIKIKDHDVNNDMDN